VLPAAHRLADADTFRRTVRRGRRAGAPTLVVHLDQLEDPGPALVGFVVSRAVGNAVIRNRVKRRLRHLSREHLDQLEALPGRGVLVVRALPPAGDADFAELGVDLSRCLGRVGLGPATDASPARTS
jgi:ribonuclease P protein component